MKHFLYTLFICLFAQTTYAQKSGPSIQPKWSFTVQLDNISMPFFSKYRPKTSLKTLTQSWRLSLGKVLLNTGDDNGGTYRSVNVGYIKNRSLQQGASISFQQGFHFQGAKSSGIFLQPALEAGCLVLLRKCNSTIIEKNFNQSAVKLQWTGGLTIGAGYARFIGKGYTATAVNYKLWLQGPFINKYAPALPHQSFGLTFYK